MYFLLEIACKFSINESNSHLPSDDVIYGIAVKLPTRLFDTVNCLTDDKAERNGMCKRLCNQYIGDLS